MKNSLKILILLWFCQEIHAQQMVIPKIEDEWKIKTGVEVYKDLSGNQPLEEVKRKANFEKSTQSIPDLGWGKSKGWLKLQVRSEVNQDLILQIHNALCEDLEFFVFQNDSIISRQKDFEFTDFRYPTFNINFKKNEDYTIFLGAKTRLNTLKFPLRFFTEKGIKNMEVNKSFETGFLLGFFILLIFLNLLIGIFFRVRIFWLLCIFGVIFSLLYLFLEGFIRFSDNVLNFQYLLFFCINFLSLLFTWSLFRVFLHNKPKWKISYIILQILNISIFGSIIFSNFWYDSVAANFIQNISPVVKIFPLFSQSFIIIISIYCFRIAPISIWYLIGLLPNIFSYIIPRFFSNFIENHWITLPQIYFLTMVWYVFVMSIGFILFLSKNFQKTHEKEITPIEIEKNIENTTKTQPKSSVLSNREADILKAFANGFTYQEISDAMLISPHTVRTHLRNIYQKLEINSKAEAVRFVIENDI